MVADLVNDLDCFVQWLSDEVAAKRISKAKFNKIIKSIDNVQNFIEEVGY
jgi:hypothetical protein